MIPTTRILDIFVRFESNVDIGDFASTCKYDNKDIKDIYIRVREVLDPTKVFAVTELSRGDSHA
jgi:hypothetical protein